MQGKKQFTDQVVTHFRLSERVPSHNLYRRLDELLDLDFLYEETHALYSHTGQPSLDPVVFFKLLLVGCLENITSDRRLLAHCALRLDILLFLGYELDQELPWHSTVSRTRQLYPAALFEHLFDRVFGLCVAQGIVKGDTQAVDSAPIKANASLDSVREKQAPAQLPPFSVVGREPATVAPPPAPVRSAPAHQLRYEATRQAKRQREPGALGAHHTQARLLSNKTHYSPTDPDARISVKPGKARALNYLCSLAVDTAYGVISHMQADLADTRDSRYLPTIVQQVQQRLARNELQLQDLVADTGYSNGFNYALLENSGVTPWIPVFGAYKPAVEGFTYHETTDEYRCRADKPLPFRKYRLSADGNWLKHYRAFYQDCQHCPFKTSCVPSADHKQLNRSAFDAAYHRAWHRQRSRQGQHMRRVRQRTVEPVFGHLLHQYGLRRINVRGQAGAQKSMLLAAIGYNLKKLLRYRPAQTMRLAITLPRPPAPPPPAPALRWQSRRKWRNAKRQLFTPTPNQSSATATSVQETLRSPRGEALLRASKGTQPAAGARSAAPSGSTAHMLGHSTAQTSRWNKQAEFNL